MNTEKKNLQKYTKVKILEKKLKEVQFWYRSVPKASKKF
jgi:hypothetical protein